MLLSRPLEAAEPYLLAFFGPLGLRGAAFLVPVLAPTGFFFAAGPALTLFAAPAFSFRPSGSASWLRSLLEGEVTISIPAARC